MKKLASVLLLSIMVLSTFLSGCGNSGKDDSESPTIKIGYLGDQTGDYAISTVPKYHAAQVAVAQINEEGGILGKKVELIAYDTQSDTTKAQEGAKKLYLQDKVAAILGGYSSPGREAVRQIAEENNQLFLYNNVYEGGDASRNLFCTSLVEDTQLKTLVEEMVKTFGKKIYTIAADYSWGQISAAWVKKFAQDNGAEVVGEEYVPLSVSQFSSSISKIQKEKPDVLFVFLVGSAQSSFFEQWANAEMSNTPMACTVNLSNGEQKRYAPPALSNMYVTTNYAEELDTPESKDFAQRFRKMFPNEAYIGADACAEYVGFFLYKKAVELAGTTDVEKVIDAFETGKVSYKGPGGMVTIDPATHQAITDQYLVKCEKDHKITVLKTLENIKPTWLSEEKGVDLRKSSPNIQYTPVEVKD